ncbi:MAG: long-chain fatty acid--CoA ligase [Bacteroidia bacterium]|nr:long-chain fatty acid--CoA ligase [Bacteroidia bacterium]MCZ2276620.1 long-chain fatty acid--CoA ligase [Bacteroidia bacterium]
MEPTRLFELLDRQLTSFPKEDSLAMKENGRWIKYSSQKVKEYSDLVSYGLLASGLNKGDKVGLISNNRPEWNFIDQGTLQTGIISVPIYPTISVNDLKYILQHAEVKVVFVSSAELYEKVYSILHELKDFKGVFTFDQTGKYPHWSEITNLGQKNQMTDKVNAIRDSILPDDMATLIYTSGTTGFPKGVMLSHHNLLSNCKATEKLCPFHYSWKALSFLPLNHVYERMLSYLYRYYGISVYYAESIESIGENLKEVKPMIFVTVPRLLEKVYEKIVSTGSELSGLKKALFFWSLNLGLRYELNGVNGWWYEMQLKVANALVFQKWREALGGNIVAIASGGAALQPRLARVFHAARIPVLEGYGLTETSPVIAVNNFQPNSIYFGTVGPVIDGVQVKIADDGEILCKGPNVMLGYYKDEQQTHAVIDAQGWLHTGDIGEFIDNRFLKITDRKKEIFKTSGGKYIVPQMIENRLKESRFIEQIMVIGENRKFASALIVPAFSFLKDWAAKEGLTLSSNEEIANSKDVRNRIREEVELVNKTLGHFETIKKFELLPRDFSIENGEMTPKLSLKRKIILENFKSYVDKIYGNGINE